MAKLIKLAGRPEWHGKVSLGPYQQKLARFCADKGTSATWFAILQAAVDRTAAGEPVRPETLAALPARLLDQFNVASELAGKRRAAFGDAVGEYVGELETGGRDAMYTYNVRRCLTIVGTAAGWKRLADVNRESLLAYLATRRADGTAPRTLKNIARTLIGFAAWCVQGRRLDANPFAGLKVDDAASEKRRRRRALTPAEVARLLAASGSRELLYRVALGTGLRRGELARLEWRDVRTDAERPHLALRAEATKSRREDSVPLHADLAARLAAAKGDAAPTDRVFATVPKHTTWTRDLARAGIDYRDDEGRIVGFHSLRVSFVSELQRAGVAPRTIMQLARHTDFRLTAGTYTDPVFLDTHGAASKLPTYADAPRRERVALAPTGTDVADSRPDRENLGCDQIRDQMPVGSGQNGSHSFSKSRHAHPSRNARKPAKNPLPSGFLALPSNTGDLGFEPRLTDPESVVLPLH